MALLKDIRLNNGIVVKYHRIENATIQVNKKIKLVIYSYLSGEERSKELELKAIQEKYKRYDELTPEELKIFKSNLQTFIERDYVELDYDSSIDITNLYEVLKETEKYKDSEDV